METFLREYGNRCYTSFSGGKDSTCLLILLRELGRTDVPVFTVMDDLGFPDADVHCRYVTSLLGFRDHTIFYAEKSAVEQLPNEEIHGTFFSTIVRFRQERGLNAVFLGLRAQESNKRFFNLMRKGNIYTTRYDEIICTPIARWSGFDVFALILSRQVPYFHIYDKDDDRAPHEIRLSWMLNPEFFSRGQVAWFKRHYPDYYNMLANRFPNLITSLA